MTPTILLVNKFPSTYFNDFIRLFSFFVVVCQSYSILLATICSKTINHMSIKNKGQSYQPNFGPKIEERKKFEENVKKLYVSGKTIQQISNNVKKSPSVIHSILKKHQIPARSNIINIDSKKLIETYENSTIEATAKFFNVSHGTIAARLKDLGIPIRPNRKFFYNENVFEKIDTEGKAYFLGLLYSDGCVYNSTISIGLHHEDAEILKKISDVVFEGKIPIQSVPARTYKNKEGRIRRNSKKALLKIHSKKCVKDIINLGCMPKKSLIVKFPSYDIIPENLFRHFIRGYFDGDGTSYHSKKSSSASLGFLGSNDFCNGLKTYIFNKLSINFSIGSKGKISCASIYKGESIKKIYGWMYSDSTIFLNRKKEKIERWITSTKKVSTGDANVETSM